MESFAALCFLGVMFKRSCDDALPVRKRPYNAGMNELSLKFALLRQHLMPGLLVLWVGVAINIDLAPALAWHDGQRLAQLAFSLLVVALLVLLPGLRRQSLLAWVALPAAVRIALGLAFGLGLCSALLAPLPRWALLDWGMHGLLLATMMAVGGQSRDPVSGLNSLLVTAFLALATAYATSSFAVYLASLLVGPDYGVGFNVRELYTGFSNLRFFGQVETMLLPFLLLPAMWWGRSRGRLILLWLVPAYWWMLAVGSGTRGTWVALLVGVLAAALFGGAAGRTWLRWQAAGLLVGLACYAVLVLGIPLLVDVPTTFMHRADDILSLSRREELWSASVMMALQHPLLGAGPMQFALHATEVGAHPHNAVLQWAAEWGIPAALAFTLVFAYAGLSFAAGVRRSAGQAVTRDALVRAALLAALAGAAAQAMVDGVLVMPVSQMLLVLLCGWALGMQQSMPVLPRTIGLRLIVAALFLSAAVWTTASGVAPELGRIEARQKAYLERFPEGHVLLPRFWAHGLLGQ